MGRSWADVSQKLQSDNVDLILFYWADGIPQPATTKGLETLKSLPSKPPILVLDHRSAVRETLEPQDVASVSALLHEMAAPVVPSLSMEELLTQINQILTRQRCLRVLILTSVNS